MNHATLIHEALILRDIEAFVAADWAVVEPDFDSVAFAGYSAESGTLRLQYASLERYRDSWLDQAAAFQGSDPARLSEQLHAAQRLAHVDVTEDRALATKVFDGVVDAPSGPSRLAWTTYYFLAFDATLQRWRITGFVGYLPSEWNAR